MAQFLTDRFTMPTQRHYTNSGQLIVPCAFARTGPQLYTKRSIGIGDSDDIVEVNREPQDVFDQGSLDTFRSAPITIGHPDGNVTSQNAKELQVGFLEGKAVRDEDLLRGTIVITDQDAIDLIEDGVKELSAGYMCDIEERDGKYYQRNIKANHIAIVEKGRAGSQCSVADQDLNNNGDDPKENHNQIEDNMAEKKVESKEGELTVDSLTSDLHKLRAKYDASVAMNDELSAELKEMKDSFDAEVLKAVEAKVQVADMAIKLSVKDSLEGLSIEDSKALIVNKALDVDMSDKHPEYIQARLDLLLEDAESKAKETELTKDMKPKFTKDSEEAKPSVDLVKDARNRMIERNKGNK